MHQTRDRSQCVDPFLDTHTSGILSHWKPQQLEGECSASKNSTYSNTRTHFNIRIGEDLSYNVAFIEIAFIHSLLMIKEQDSVQYRLKDTY